MRPLLSPPTAVAKTHSLSYPAASSTTSTSTCSPDTCKWKPYSNSNNDFEANAVLILIVLLCALTCALALNTAIRCFLRGNNLDQQQPSPQNQRQQQLQQRDKPSDEVVAASLVAAPTLVYSAGMKLTGAEAECVICLSEFEEGDVIQVLEMCNHGFHLQCIRKWLYSQYSCPICRCSCLLSPTSSHHNSNHSSQLAVPEN